MKTSFLNRIAHWFSSPQAQAVEHAIEMAAIDAAPIVAGIAAMVPNRTFRVIAAAYAAYAVPLAMKESQLSDPALQAMALRDLATSVLRKNHQDASANVLNAAVEIAVAANKVGSIPPAPVAKTAA
jgi:hypothetical protein